MPIQITENEDKELEVTFEDGKKRSFYRGWQIILNVHSIQEAQDISHVNDAGVQAKRHLIGTAVLQDRDISVIGRAQEHDQDAGVGHL